MNLIISFLIYILVCFEFVHSSNNETQVQLLTKTIYPLNYSSLSDHSKNLTNNNNLIKLLTYLNQTEQVPNFGELLIKRWNDFYESNAVLFDLLSNMISRFQLQSIAASIASFINMIANFLVNSIGFRQTFLAPPNQLSLIWNGKSSEDDFRSEINSNPFSMASSSFDLDYNSVLSMDRKKRFLLPSEFYKMKAHKFNTLIAYKKWKLEQLFKIKVWLLLLLGRIKQAILGKNIIRDQDIDLLIRLFYPELFPTLH